MATHDIERTSLDAHVSLCEERYNSLTRRIDQIEMKIEKIEKTVEEIRDDLRNFNERNAKKWDTTQVAVIGVLLTVVGVLLSRIFFHGSPF